MEAAKTYPYAVARQDYPWKFPRDSGSHPEFQTEWWYYTGHLFTQNGDHYGYELTFFHSRLPVKDGHWRSKWGGAHLFFAHFALTDPQNRAFHYTDVASRGALGLSGADTTRQNVWLKDWSARMEGANQHLKASQEGWRLDLNNVSLKPLALNGIKGYSQKGDGPNHASEYYSYTRLKASGTLWKAGKPLAVTGESWMDHEFSSGSLAPNETGWDWFSLQLSTGDDLMLYRLRRNDGSSDPHSGGTWVGPQGKASPLHRDDYRITELSHWTSPHTGTTYPSLWRVRVPQKGLDLQLTPLLADQELNTAKTTRVTYWEGAVDFTGTLKGRRVTGHGYVELTGYSATLKGKA